VGILMDNQNSNMFIPEYMQRELSYLEGLVRRARQPLNHAEVAAAARMATGCGVAHSWTLAEMVLGPDNLGNSRARG
jgi:hypothetical protein